MVTVTSQQVTGVETPDAPLARVYPNSTDGKLTIQFETQGEYVVTLSDMAGKILLRQTVNDQTAQLDITKFPDGTYLLTIDDGKQQNTMRVVKN